MYAPRLYSETDPAVIDAFIRENGFGTLISAASGDPFATHIPMELLHAEGGGRIIEGHVSRANPHWKLLEGGGRALAIFSGPHTYVSSSWYGHENVPTWNYMVVHASGPVRLVTDEGALRAMVRRLSLHYEPADAPPPRFDTDALTPAFYAKEIRGIVGFEIAVDTLEAAFKLSQNRNAADHATVIRKLKERGDENSVAIARAMELRAPK